MPINLGGLSTKITKNQMRVLAMILIFLCYILFLLTNETKDGVVLTLVTNCILLIIGIQKKGEIET